MDSQPDDLATLKAELALARARNADDAATIARQKLEIAKGKTITGRCWFYVRDDRPFGGRAPTAAKFYSSRDWRGEHLDEHLTR